MSRRVSQQFSISRPETPRNDISIHQPESSTLAPSISLADPSDGVDTPKRDQYLLPPHNFDGRSPSTSSARIDGPSIASAKSGGTLRKKPSTNKRASLSRRSSRRSLQGTSKSPEQKQDEQYNNVFRIPIPTTGNPTEVLANRFQAWRKLLKDLTIYFREIQTCYEARSKALMKLSTSINSTMPPREFMSDGGLNEAIGILRGFTQMSVSEANKARVIEEDVITQLNGLRNDLNQKIKEIKSLSGDFKNSVEREKDTTKRVVDQLGAAITLAETNPAAASGKGDPFIVRLAVERQVEKQIDEENYLHSAYLNLEGSGRELEAIVVGEIQKAYNAYCGILKREGDYALEAVEKLRSGPIALPKDWEWESFVQGNSNFISPNLPLRKLDNITYPGKFSPAAVEIRAGTLERKSKYLKSYTSGWYVLSATHIHEFKSADHLHTQSPVMSLFLLDQKLGSHSQPGASSHKFSLKGRQTGGMHRGHSWVFRAESYDTMMAWYEDITSLVEKTGDDKLAFVRKHVRNTSGPSLVAPSLMSSEAQTEDEADRIRLAPAIFMQEPLSEPMPAMHQQGSGPPFNEVSASGASLIPPPMPRSAASSVYGPDSVSVDMRPTAGTRSTEASEYDQSTALSGELLSPRAGKQGSLAVPRSSGFAQYVQQPTDLSVDDSQSNTLNRSNLNGARQDMADNSGAQSSIAPSKQQLEGAVSYSSAGQMLQRSAPPAIDIGSTANAPLTQNGSRQDMHRDSGEYSPTARPKDPLASIGTTYGSLQRPLNVGIDVATANKPSYSGHKGAVRESAEYSPTSMPKMALNFAGALPVSTQTIVRPIPIRLAQNDEAKTQDYSQMPPTHDQHVPSYPIPTLPISQNIRTLPPGDAQSDRTSAAGREIVANTSAPAGLADSAIGTISREKLEQSESDNGSLQRSEDRWRQPSSVYEGNSMAAPTSILQSSYRPTTTMAGLTRMPQVDTDATTTTTEDRDEMTTMTEARTSVDTTIPITESQDSDAQGLNEKDDDDQLIEEGMVKSGKWDGTVPMPWGVQPVLRHSDTVRTVSDLYVPGKYAGMKSAFSEHFDD